MDKNTPPEERALILLKAAILQQGQPIEISEQNIRIADKYVLNITAYPDKTVIELDYK